MQKLHASAKLAYQKIAGVYVGMLQRPRECELRRFMHYINLFLRIF